MDFYDKLDFLMKGKKLKNLYALASECSVPYTTLRSFYTNGISNVKLSTIEKICTYFDVSLDYLMRDEITDPNYGKDRINSPHDKNTAALLASYEKLNEVGKQEAVKRVSELTEIPKYISKKNTKTEFANEIMSEEEIEKAGEAYKEGLRLQANSQTTQASS